MKAQILGRGYVRKLRITLLKQETLSSASFAILSLIFSDTRPQQRQGVGSHSGADKGIYTLSKTIVMHNPFLTLKNLVARFAEMNDRVRLVGLQETYALATMELLLTSVIRVCPPMPRALRS